MMAETEFRRIKAVIANGIMNESLCTEWDLKFLADFAIKMDQYKRHTSVSEKQMEQFDRIEAYLQKELGFAYEE